MTSRTRNSVAFAFLFLASFIAFWLWWNRPRKVDMAEYAPADALIFLEANDLPDIVAGLASTTAWQELAPAAGLRADTGSYLKLSRLAAWTGIGPSELVLFARAQAAAVVFGFDAAEEPGSSLRIRPQAAFIFETHSREGRAIAATEKLVGDLARRIFAAPRFGKRQDVAGAHIFTWGSADGSRQIVAAVMEGVVILGNEEAAVQRCLAVKRGEQASLAEDQQLVTMRERVVRAGALSFGYVSPAGARKLLEVAALAYAGQLSTNPSAQSAFAVLLPQLAERLLGSAAWSSRLVDGAVEDRYFLTGRGGLPERLRSPLVPFRETLTGAPNLLPAGLYQLTSYNFREPDAAWRALNQALSTQLDITLAPAGVRYLDEWLRPFGIESPREFFQTVGPGLYTARLDPAGEGLVFTAPVRDEAALRAQLLAVLGRRPRAERIGVHEMLFSGAEDGMAAGFVSGHVIMGAAEDVRQCLRQVAGATPLGESEPFRRAVSRLAQGADAAAIVTLTAEREEAREFVNFIARLKGLRQTTPDPRAFDAALAKLPYAATETHLLDGGVERRTLSAFGQLAAIVRQFGVGAPGAVSEQRARVGVSTPSD